MNTLFALLAQYGTAQIPLERCADLFGLEPEMAKKRAAMHNLPVPAFRAGSAKSPWLVDANRLAAYLDERKAQAEAEWKKIRMAS